MNLTLSAMVMALALGGCIGAFFQPQTVEIEAKAYVEDYLRSRDEFRDRTAAARARCAKFAAPVTPTHTSTITPKAVAAGPLQNVPTVPPPPTEDLDLLKVKCVELTAQLVEWRRRDTAMLEAILKKDRIRGEAIEAMWPIVDRILTIAADVLP